MIELQLIYIGINWEKKRHKECLEGEDLDFEEDNLAAAEDTVAGETSTSATTEIIDSKCNFIHMELGRTGRRRRSLK